MNRSVEQLSRLVQCLARRRDLPHVLLTVESLDGSFRWSGAAGAAQPEGTPMRVDTPFYIASIDKLLTATVVMQLSESRALSLDAPAATCLPPGTMQRLHVFHGTDFSLTITVRHLLSHTSGLADFLEDRPAGGRSLLADLLRDDDRAWTSAESLNLVRTRLQPHFRPQDPGSPRPRIRYSSTNFELLNLLIEHLTGQPLPTVFARRLFVPLGLRHIWFAGEQPPSPTDATAACLWRGTEALDRPRALQSLRSVISNTSDLVGLFRGLVTGRLFTQPGTFAQMQQPWHRFGLPLDLAALRAPGWPIEYGLGLMRFQIPRVLTPFHPMPPVIGHTGSTGCWLFYCPPMQLFLAGTVDQLTAGAIPFRIAPRLLRLLSG
jgi:CubicO group peptidase (beta-lactamase class C family)